MPHNRAGFAAAALRVSLAEGGIALKSHVGKRRLSARAGAGTETGAERGDIALANRLKAHRTSFAPETTGLKRDERD